METRISLEERKIREERGVDISHPKFPTDIEDFVMGAPVGIFRIQSIQNISIEDMTRGLLGPGLMTSPHSMSWLDCLHIANKAKEKNNLVKTVEWIQMAVTLANASATQDIPDLKIGLNLPSTDVMQHLNYLLTEAVKYHDSMALKYGKFSNTVEENPAVTRIVPFNETLARSSAKKVKKWKKKFEKFVAKFPMFEESDVYTVHDRLAYGDKIDHQCQDLPESPFIVRHGSHQCHNLHKSNPFLRLGPRMLEILAQSPTVALFHNFLTDRECEQLRDKGRNRMKATPLSVQKGNSQAKLNSYTDRRTSKIRYISHRKDSLARNINDKISRALDFDLNGEPIAAENFQLMNYGLGNVGQSNRNVKLHFLFILSGGYIELHRDANVDDVNYDAGPPAWLISGERLMTFMVYLSSTEKGGNTVFPLQGVSVPPREGTALFWHTVTSSGYQDQRMKHLGCPVVYGDKWIVNKWIKWHHHMFSHPCHVEKGKFYSINT